MSYDVCREHQIIRGIAPRHYHRFMHRGMRSEHRLDLAELDAKAANFHLLIGSADELDFAIVAISHKIAGAVEPSCP